MNKESGNFSRKGSYLAAAIGVKQIFSPRLAKWWIALTSVRLREDPGSIWWRNTGSVNFFVCISGITFGVTTSQRAQTTSRSDIVWALDATHHPYNDLIPQGHDDTTRGWRDEVDAMKHPSTPFPSCFLLGSFFHSQYFCCPTPSPFAWGEVYLIRFFTLIPWPNWCVPAVGLPFPLPYLCSFIVNRY